MDESKVIIQPLNKHWYANKVATVDVLRLDLIDPVISGNKWYKLKYNLQYAKEQDYKSILTFGGAYSNHLIAAAAAAQQYGIPAIGVVRGNDGTGLTDTLKSCITYGMQLHFISREEYAGKDDVEWLKQLSLQFDGPLIIPEGGANEQGRLSAGDIAAFISPGYTHVLMSAGTGTTFIGLRNALPASQQLSGFVPMKGGAYLKDEIISHLLDEQNVNWQLFDQWHFGGFGKWNDELVSFMNDFYNVNNIPLDIVYTGKMMYGIRELLAGDFFPLSARILCIHSGGLQGNASVSDRLVYKGCI